MPDSTSHVLELALTTIEKFLLRAGKILKTHEVVPELQLTILWFEQLSLKQKHYLILGHEKDCQWRWIFQIQSSLNSPCPLYDISYFPWRTHCMLPITGHIWETPHKSYETRHIAGFCCTWEINAKIYHPLICNY